MRQPCEAVKLGVRQETVMTIRGRAWVLLRSTVIRGHEHERPEFHSNVVCYSGITESNTARSTKDAVPAAVDVIRESDIIEYATT